MNLPYLLQKRHKAIIATEAVKMGERPVNGVTWKGLRLAPSGQPQLRIVGASRWLRGNPGWYISGAAEVAYRRPDGSVRSSHFIQGEMQPVVLPCPGDAEDLTIHAEEGAWLLTSCPFDRRMATGWCVGDGVELGPGPTPRIINSETVKVLYIEPVPAEELRQRLPDNPNKELWQLYVVGRADHIPVADGSLDFIFSSHVFEHLANPLGHLEHWGRKLKPGGRIVAIVPDYLGTKDFKADPATVAELREEYACGGFEPTRHRFDRWAAIHEIPQAQADKLWASKRSFHVHAYGQANMPDILRAACELLRFSDFSVVHTPNWKEFFFRIVK